MLSAKCEKGPLSMLLKCVKEKSKVKVFIRRVADIRGFVVGFLQAADKHFNMVSKVPKVEIERKGAKRGLRRVFSV